MMNYNFLAVATTLLSVIVAGVSSLQCYRCSIVPTKENPMLCSHFNYSKAFVADCPFSTLCEKRQIYLDLLNGDRVVATFRDCAFQRHKYQDYKDGKWTERENILEPYREDCEDEDSKGLRVTPTRYCYCRGDLCNSAPQANHEGYTDIMGVIVVFNLMKYINSLR